MKKIFTFIYVLVYISLYAQQPDTCIIRDAYRSYFNKQLKIPVFVYYKLYRGGGDCNRMLFRFKNDVHLNMATGADYAKTGYDIGHLANAEDFADSCLLEEQTFRYYNAIPQTKNLNRGIWKSWETKIRKESQSDSLLIICGGITSGILTMGADSVAIPEYCFKVVQSLTTAKVLYVLLFTNKKSGNTYMSTSLLDIFCKLNYDFGYLLKK